MKRDPIDKVEEALNRIDQAEADEVRGEAEREDGDA